MTVVAAIPAFNEEIAIGSVIARARQHVDEVLVIDDGSADNTYRVAELMGATVLRHENFATNMVAIIRCYYITFSFQLRSRLSHFTGGDEKYLL